MIGKKNTDEWRDLIRKRDRHLISRLESVYGENRALLEERLNALLTLTDKFGEIYGTKEVGFVRAPGRLNTLGRHADHRGAYINPMSIDKEILLCYAGRNDDSVEVYNLDRSYGTRDFRITEECAPVPITSDSAWLDWTQKKTDERKAAGTNEDWSPKLKAAPVYLHMQFPGEKLLGFEAVVSSSIPGKAGLSSSSAIVVASMEIMMDVNHISLDDQQFVRHCGAAEWYVGTRGGSGDHAAIKFGRLGKITHMRTLPELMIDAYLPFPEGYQIVIFDSGIEAVKTGAAGQKFNEKTATYEIGEIYLREYMQERHGDILQRIVDSRQGLEIEKKFHLGDVVECLQQQQIYRLVQHLPERINRQALLKQWPEDQALLKQQFATHSDPEGDYQIRMVLTYGIAEAERSRMLKEVLNRNRVDIYGQLMNVSHNGDRVSLSSPRFNPEQDLHLQPGDYNCSIPEIDGMVDIALETGADGAQISGAGMGGSMMVLVKTEAVDSVIDAMRARYYRPHNIEEKNIVASPVQGAGLL